MSEIETRFEDMDPDEAAKQVADLAARLETQTTQGRSAQEIRQLFQLLNGYMVLHDDTRGSKLYTTLGEAIADYRAQHPDAAEGYEFYFDWGMLAVRLMPDARKSFASLGVYEDLIQTFDEGPEAQRHKGLLLRTQLLRHVALWVEKKGGDMSYLEPEDQAFVRAARDEYEALMDAELEQAEERSDFQAIVDMYRDGAQHYQLVGRPNDAVTCLKEAIAYLPDVPDFQPVDQADLQVQLGRIFVGHGKTEVAIRYFTQALETYEAAGEDYEVQAAQADGWIEEARKRAR